MSDEDELANVLDEIESSDDSDILDNDADAEIAKPDESQNDRIPAEEDSMSSDDDTSAIDNGVTQAEVYENLKRIGELEDEKRKIQEELRERTEQLRAVVRHIDRGSILYKMLQSALADSAPKAVAANAEKKATAKGAAKATAKKASKKKPRRK
jgi:hypothetical protein